MIVSGVESLFPSADAKGGSNEEASVTPGP